VAGAKLGRDRLEPELLAAEVDEPVNTITERGLALLQRCKGSLTSP
jgi:hypothetical protein